MYPKTDCCHEWGDKKITLKHKSGETNPGKEGWYKDKGASDDRGDSFCIKCGAWKGSLGQEPTFDLYIEHLCSIFDECKRVLKKTGSLWVNLADTFWGGGQGGSDYSAKNITPSSMFPKIAKGKGYQDTCLCLIPQRFSIEMVSRGWILHNEIIWYRKNSMPSSASKRFTVDFEKLFFFTKSKNYYFEQQFEKYTKPMNRWGGDSLKANGLSKWDNGTGQTAYRDRYMRPNEMGRNLRTVWTINTKPSNWDFCSKCNTFYEGTERSRIGKVKTIVEGKETTTKICPNCKSTSDWVDHFAVFPSDLVKTPIRAGCPKEICNKCGLPREKIYKKGEDLPKGGGASIKYSNSGQGLSPSSLLTKTIKGKIDIGYSDCGCGEGFHPGVVLDPFSGAGTTGVMAKKLGVDCIGIELNPKYAKMSEARIKKTKVQTNLFDS